MHFRLFGLILCVWATFWVCGCAKQHGRFTDEQMQDFPLANRYDLPEASGGMSMSLHAETITYEEVLQVVEETLRPAAPQMERGIFVQQSLPLMQQAIRNKAADILLYEMARQQAPANVQDALDKAAEQEIKRFVAGHGNNYALAEATIRKMGMDWRSFRDFQRKRILTQSYLSGKLNERTRFTHSEMIAHYEKIKAEQFCRSGTLEFHAIDIIPSRLTADQIGQGQTASEAALALAAALADRTRGGEDFADLARTYSHGPLARSGGKWMPVTIGANALSEPYDVLETAALELEPGQVSDPIVNDGHVFVLRLDRKDEGGCTPFTEVQPQIEQQLIFLHQRKQYENYISDLMQQVDRVEVARFAEFCANAAYDRWHRAG